MTWKKNSPAQAQNEQSLVLIKEDSTFTSSRKVAEFFGKEHKNVLRDIEVIKKDLDPEFSRLNFEPRKYQLRGRQFPEYLITKNGFALLAMGFTGKKAMQFKVAYIKQFDQMQDIVTKRLYGDGVTLSELKRKVKWQTTWNLFGNDETPVYLLSEVLNYLGYKNINHATMQRYAPMLALIDGRRWAHEEFVKMKVKQRAALNLRNQTAESCNRIALAENIKSEAIAKLRVKNSKGGSRG